MATEREQAVVSFLRGEDEPAVGENEEYARVYLEVRGPEKWFVSTSARGVESIRRELYPFYMVPVPNRGGYWLLDPTKAITVSAFDEFNPTLLAAQLGYLIDERRTSLDFTNESGQALFDYISGSLLDYTRLQEDYNRDLSAVISKEFLTKDYLGLVEAARPLVGNGALRSSPYGTETSEKINPMFTWDEAFRLSESVEKHISLVTEYLRRCNESITKLEARASEFGDLVARAKAALAKEFEDYKSLKGREEVDITEKCETDRLNMEKNYKPLFAKAEKQLKTAREANEAAQLELMPVQSVYDEMHGAAAKLQDMITQSKTARDEAVQKATEFRAKYAKLQEDQSNLQARSTKGTDSKSVPEDTPLDAEMAYLERQAITYEDRQRQLEEELERLSADQTKGNSELDKFEKTYRPLKESVDETRASLEESGEDLEKLKRQNAAEMDLAAKSCQGELGRIKSEIAGAEAVLGHRTSSIDQSFIGLQTSLNGLKATMASAGKYADETIRSGLEAITLSVEVMSRMIYYPLYLAVRYGTPSPVAVAGRTWQLAAQTMPDGSPSTATYAQAPIDSYVMGRLPSFQWSKEAGEFDLFSQIEFKGRLIAGFKELMKKGLISEGKMLKLAKEVAVIDLKLP